MCFSSFRPLRSTKKCTKKGVHEALKKLHAHPLFISVYVVYYARVGADVRMCVCVCVCVCVLHNYLD